MKKIFTLVMSLCISATCLCGCGESKPVLKVYNWGEYIADEVIDDFENEYGVKVVYDTFDSNEDMFAKVNAGGGNTYDVVVPSDYMIQQMIENNMLAKLNFDNISNYKNINPQFLNPAYDPNNEYSVPYLFGAVGILYNKTMVQEPVTSMNILWNEKYSQKIFMLNSIRDTMGMTLKMLGYSMNSDVQAEVDEAKNKLIDQRDLVLAYCTDEVKDKMVAGEGALALCYPGVAMEAISENPDLDFAIPSEGTNIAVDAFVVLETSKVKDLAEKFINYMNEPEVAAKNALLGYGSPNTEALKLIDPEIANDTRIYPTEEVFANSENFDANQKRDAMYVDAWTEIKSY